MTEDDKGGANGTKPPENKTAKISFDQAIAENAALKLEVDALKKTIEEQNKTIKELNDVLEGQLREQEIRRLLPRTNLTVEDIVGWPLDVLREKNATLDQARLPTYKNVHFGRAGVDEKEDDGLTVGDLSVVTAAKRKAGRA